MTEQHFTELCQYERQLAGEGVRLIAGIDEAGRGPLAGPVAAACVIFPARGPFVRGADDSKKLSEKRREALETEYRADCIYRHFYLFDGNRSVLPYEKSYFFL